MTTVNKSLSYIDNTLVYNNECELNFSYEYYPYQTLFEDTGVYYSKALQDHTKVPLNTNFGDYRYSVLSFNHSGTTACKQNGLQIYWNEYPNYGSWVLFNWYQANAKYKPVCYTMYDENFITGNNYVVSTKITGVGYNQRYWNYTKYNQNNNIRFKMIADNLNRDVSAYWNNEYCGYKNLSGSIPFSSIRDLTLYHNESANDKFRISNIKVYGTDDFNIATGLA